MKNYDVVVAPEDVPTKKYADDRIHVGTAQPLDAEIWIDTDEPDPTNLLAQWVASLEARVTELEAKLP